MALLPLNRRELVVCEPLGRPRQALLALLDALPQRLQPLDDPGYGILLLRANGPAQRLQRFVERGQALLACLRGRTTAVE